MGLFKDLEAKLVSIKKLVDARNAALQAGRPAKVLTDEELAKGHPKVTTSIDFQGVGYGVRLGTWFGWIWLAFTCVHGAFMFAGLSGGTVKMNGTLITQPHWWDFLSLSLIYVPFLLIGLAFSLARYRVTLSDAAFIVRWRILPYLGWTWRLPVARRRCGLEKVCASATPCFLGQGRCAMALAPDAGRSADAVGLAGGNQLSRG